MEEYDLIRYENLDATKNKHNRQNFRKRWTGCHQIPDFSVMSPKMANLYGQLNQIDA